MKRPMTPGTAALAVVTVLAIGGSHLFDRVAAWRLYRLYRTHNRSRRASLMQVWRCLKHPIN